MERTLYVPSLFSIDQSIDVPDIHCFCCHVVEKSVLFRLIWALTDLKLNDRTELVALNHMFKSHDTPVIMIHCFS